MDRIMEIDRIIRKKYGLPEPSLEKGYDEMSREEFERLRKIEQEKQKKYAKEFANQVRKYIKENTLQFKNKYPIRGVQFNPNNDVVPEWIEECPLCYIQKVNSPATDHFLTKKDKEVLNKFYDEYERKEESLNSILLLSDEDLEETGFFDDCPNLRPKK